MRRLPGSSGFRKEKAQSDAELAEIDVELRKLNEVA